MSGTNRQVEERYWAERGAVVVRDTQVPADPAHWERLVLEVLALTPRRGTKQVVSEVLDRHLREVKRGRAGAERVMPRSMDYWNRGKPERGGISHRAKLAVERLARRGEIVDVGRKYGRRGRVWVNAQFAQAEAEAKLKAARARLAAGFRPIATVGMKGVEGVEVRHVGDPVLGRDVEIVVGMGVTGLTLDQALVIHSLLGQYLRYAAAVERLERDAEQR